MRFETRPFAFSVVLAVSAAPALADDCAQPKAAMLVSAKTPYSETIMTSEPGGKTTTSHLIQTATTKYVERNGVWKSLPVTSADLVETLNETLRTARFTCMSTGMEHVNGQAASVYVVHMENAGVVTESTLWISAENRQLKANTTSGGHQFTATFDYDHVQPPAGATSAVPKPR